MESLSQPMSHNAALFFQFANASFDKAASGPLRFHVGHNRFSGPFLSSSASAWPNPNREPYITVYWGGALPVAS